MAKEYIGHVYNPNALPESTNSSFVSIYPNPTFGEINILFPEKFDKATLFNVFGQKVLSVRQETKLDLSNLQSGVYVLSIFTEKDIYTVKIIKKE